MIICKTCAVEYDEPPPDVCPICSDERQYVPATGQVWLSIRDLHEGGAVIRITQHSPILWGLSAPGVGIGQQMLLLHTPQGNLLWDPLGFIDEQTVAWLRAQGPVLGIAASHPHMFGVQVSWSEALDDAPVLVNEADAEWLGRRSPAITFWSGKHQVTEGLTLYQIGGHFRGSTVAHWTGDDGILLAGDTVMVNPDRVTTSFMRSYPNRLPLSAGVVNRIAAQLAPLSFEQVWSNFGNSITTGADMAIQRSAERHASWVRGDFDHLT
ncbi:hydrolase [Phytoactinopolyspora limicola]|uniref:hydrolase n=1 Tax=Phytoactinopolyspora limicola TaxID=2715536 RepID=UPI0014082192|nr:hydrolase [Phytoactinopolyspora limicola]